MVLGGPERFSSGGRGVGIVGLVVVGVFVAAGLLGGDDGDGRLAPWLLAAGLLFGVLVRCVLVRPAVVLREDELELRNILRDHRIPYARISDVHVKHVTVVEADGRRYLGTGLGRARRSLRREGADGQGGAIDVLARFGSTFDAGDRDHTSVGAMVQTKVRHRVWHAEGTLRGEPGPIRHRWAWPEITALAVLALATVVLALVG